MNNFDSLGELDASLKINAKENNIIIEGSRALFFSKLLGLITTDSPFIATEVYENIRENPDIQNSLISSQMEKLLFWNDIYSKVNRHADKGRLLEKESIFTVYPISCSKVPKNLLTNKVVLYADKSSEAYR